MSTWNLLRHFTHPGGQAGFIIPGGMATAGSAQLVAIGYPGVPEVRVNRSTDQWANFTLVATGTFANGILGTLKTLSSGRVVLAIRDTNQMDFAYSDDDGATWTAVAPVAYVGVNGGPGVIVEMPTALGTLFCIAFNDGAPTSRLFKSTDFGATWSDATPAAAPWTTQALETGSLIALASGNLLAGCTTVGGGGYIIRSTNVGAAWSTVFTAGALNSGDIASFVEVGGAIYASGVLGLATGAPFYRSTDETTWTQVARPTVAVDGFRMIMCLTMAAPTPALLIAVGSGHAGGADQNMIFQSVDGGVTWTRDTGPGVIDAGTIVGAFMLGNDNFGLAAGTTDAIWVTGAALFVASELNPVVNAGTGRLVSAFPQSDGTVVTFYSTDEGATWTQGATIPDLRGAATPPTSKLRAVSDGILLLGLKGNVSGTMIARSTNSGVSWADVLTLAGDNVINNFAVLAEPGTLADESPSAPPIQPSLTADSEHQSVPVEVTSNFIFFLINAIGADLLLVNDGNAALIIVTTGLVLSKADAPLMGHYLGWTLQGEDPPFRVETVEMEVVPSRTWDNTP